MAAIASPASPPAFLTLAISSEAVLRSARMVSTSVVSRRRSLSTARNSSSDCVLPRRCSAARTTSGFERTSLMSSIVTPRVGRRAAGGARARRPGGRWNAYLRAAARRACRKAGLRPILDSA